MSILVSQALSEEASGRGNENQREQKAAQQCGSQYGIPLVYLRDLSCAKVASSCVFGGICKLAPA